ncbi:hypothetical protein A2331_06325 [Candidatus Falkowbacteria bacterium RIFOXYB2_FULL_34_18]|uniref:Uncharacterized protein n=1 Tax=Candidatus Falkowbacteria bacterium RIFOXYD2_FULL_34_120 TaxID=1798007 RepID=A0A1F5TQ34_9BACT|nr:MAG: hypothetical protein A2331_06325 [Candidatus Falkowbacteria bacterium RIFOXYB2_FULL_34_18]OGF29385.1 MAG: hypothetical protein A2500_06415 [Candidatus Falkowbacteria bacterium RIFOXYC12_FULL_34_55]OGF36594.1 MAG: hypothetical protein A2466_06750 [Candidatus Falkowbacteria bacterium RIFOXYC2_FULL_34_220]OGF38812.1 MAG: hypothetical protein A2515_03195 [Candidatus Falkowbacteria bacterium RIFOXYD12_FULL_34_57]OGF41083.1 MAG: hypothetical protein A2531_03300 [Candidatus Falkowbacteria bact
MSEDKQNKGFQSLGDILNISKEEDCFDGLKTNKRKGTAYVWQDFALRVIKELNIPSFKRSAVFKICKENSKETVERAMNDTKELCKTGERWKYFFKIINQ